jgi:hypothetical protein
MNHRSLAAHRRSRNTPSGAFLLAPGVFDERLFAATEAFEVASRQALVTGIRTFAPRSLREAVSECVSGLHHVATYIGDYCDESTVDGWHHFLQERVHDGSLRQVIRGPSHIAPREYGTPGWWFVLEAPHALIEVFTCRAYGRWATLSRRRKTRLMSHVALTVHDVASLIRAIAIFRQSPDNEVIAHVRDDVCKCEYAHIRNNRTDRVLELVSEMQAPRPNRVPT